MSSKTKSWVNVAMCAAVLAAMGCRDDPDAALPPAPASDSSAKPPVESPAAEEPTNSDQSGAAAEIEAALASLSPEDRELAITQKICPVSNEPLGTMGTPIKVAVAGQDVFICCEHCNEALQANPAEHLAKIGKQPIETPVQ
jgi:hypothetical protein